MCFRRIRPSQKIELARHQHDRCDRHSKHGKHQIVRVIHRFERSSTWLRPEPSPLAIRASARGECQRVRKPLTIRDRRHCERRAMAPSVVWKNLFLSAVAIDQSQLQSRSRHTMAISFVVFGFGRRSIVSRIARAATTVTKAI